MDDEDHLNWGQKNDLFLEINSLVLKGHSVREACRLYAADKGMGDIKVSSIFQRMKANGGRSDGRQIFTNEFELEIVAVIQAFDNLHRTLTPPMIKSWVKQFRKDAPDWDPTDWYIMNF